MSDKKNILGPSKKNKWNWEFENNFKKAGSII